MPYPFNQQNQFTGTQYASPTPSIPTGGITYPGFGGGGGNTPGIASGIDYPRSPGYSPTSGVTYPGSGGGGSGGGGSGGVQGITYPRYSGYNGPSGGQQNPSSNTINVSAGSRGVSPLSAPVPDLSFADPATLRRLNIDDLVYNPNSGGYYSRNAHYIGNYGNQGVYDANATRRAEEYYNYIGSLPTRPIGTAALNQFYSSFGGGPTRGPSYNSILSNFYSSNPDQARYFGLGPTYTGPYMIGNSTNYNRFGLGY